MLRKLKLKTRLTIISASVIVLIAVTLTILSVRNARTTYGDQYSISFGDELSLSVNGEDLHIGGKSKLSDWLRFAQEMEEDQNAEESELSGANRAFALESTIAMLLIGAFGILLTYVMVSNTLKPLGKLNSAMKHVDENNLSSHIDTGNRTDEIGSMADSYNKMLDRLHKSFRNQKNFASNAAHELKTPLATMKTSIQVLEMEKDPSSEDLKKAIQMMAGNTDRLIRIVGDLLSLNAEQNHAMNESIPIEEILDIVIDELSLTAREKNVRITTGRIEGSLMGNPLLFYRALFNLVENAIKYNRENGQIAISSGVKDDKLAIAVRDSGLGIPAEHLKNIFEPFYRVDTSRSRAMGGSGLGLSIAAAIVESHGGTLTVHSEEGRGTEFLLLFPIH